MFSRSPIPTCLTLLTWALLAAAAAGAQTIWHVDDDAPNDPCPGDPNCGDPLEDGSPDHPFDAIQEGIDAAVDGDTVLVADGTYTGVGNKNLDYAGKAITVRSENGPDTCVIDCEHDGRGFHFHNGETDEVVVEGFIITHANDESDYGAIYCDEASPTIANCRLTENYGPAIRTAGSSAVITQCEITCNLGPAIGCYSGSPVVSNCTISDNLAGSGAVFCNGSDVTITGCAIERNVGGWGGGVAGGLGRIDIRDCTIADNIAGCFAGGVTTECADVTISNCAIYGNVGGYSGGGGVACLYDTAVVRDCTIAQNFGSGFYSYSNQPVIVDCTITGNTAYQNPGYGGGICCFDGATITNCVITDNTAEQGGAVWGADLNIGNCTIADNEADAGGGIACTGSTTMANCVLWGNAALQGPQVAVVHAWESPTLTVSFCDVEGGEAPVHVEEGSTLVWGDGNINVDPALAFADDLHLLLGSPCIDAGTNNPPGGLPSDDFDGNPRPLDGDGDGSAIADIGAYEFNPGAPSIARSPLEFVVLAPEGGPNPDDQVLSLRNCGGGTLDWEIAELCTWLAADPSAGQSAGEIDQVVLSADVSGLWHGAYVCELTISAAQAVNTPRVVTVTLYISSTLEVPAMYGTIQAAIDAAVPGDTVLVADGTYTGAGNKDLDLGGKPITVRSENGPDNCIIDCESDGRGFYFHNQETEESVVDGFTITNGFASSSGAGVHCWRSSPTIANCAVTGNTTERGGAIYCDESRPTITNCTITGNTASGDGGGVYCYMSNPIITNCTIAGNTAARNGGGILCRWSNPTIDGCAITSNSAEHNGGGLSCRSGSSPSINNCMIASNSAVEYGGGAYCGSGQAVFTSCTISGNTAACGGGVWGADPNIVNCTITDNEADQGGGVSSWRNLTIANSILWGNAAPQGPQIAVLHNVVPTTLTVLFSDVEGGEDAADVEEGGTLIWGDGNIDADPLFADPNHADYHLLAGSPCIDAGCNCAVPEDLGDLDGDGVLWEYVPFDLDGEGRFFDDPDTPDSGSGLPPIVDMGAYEFGGSELPPCHGDLDGDRDVDLDDLAVLLAHYGMLEGANGADGDMDCDGDIQIADLAEFLGAYGDVCE